jgi:hypothetical protein
VQRAKCKQAFRSFAFPSKQADIVFSYWRSETSKVKAIFAF